jgi:hypothetical protein
MRDSRILVAAPQLVLPCNDSLTLLSSVSYVGQQETASYCECVFKSTVYCICCDYGSSKHF